MGKNTRPVSSHTIRTVQPKERDLYRPPRHEMYSQGSADKYQCPRRSLAVLPTFHHAVLRCQQAQHQCLARPSRFGSGTRGYRPVKDTTLKSYPAHHTVGVRPSKIKSTRISSFSSRRRRPREEQGTSAVSLPGWSGQKLRC